MAINVNFSHSMMFALAILLFFVTCASAEVESSSDCATWPSNLKTMRECCQIPSHISSAASHKCIESCQNKTTSEQSNCTLECYLKQTNLMNDTTINKNVVKKIYVESFLWYEQPWSKVVNEGVNNCVYNATDSIQQNVINFYECVTDRLLENCMNFAGFEECDATIEHFLKCKKTPAKCVNPIFMEHFISCCKMPFYSGEELNGKFRLDCQKKELYTNRKFECAYNQTIAESGAKNDGTFDVGVLKKMLIESSNNSQVWLKPIEKAVEKCGLSVKDKQISISSLYLTGCLIEYFIDNCVEFETSPNCHQVKRFKMCEEKPMVREAWLEWFG